MRFTRRRGGIVEFREDPLSLFLQHRQLSDDSLEAGGVLLGRLILCTSDIVIDEATEPATADRRSRASFLRAREPAQRRVERAWQESHGTKIYLGEWHSHPEDRPEPSPHDRSDWGRLARMADYEQETLLFAIVGRCEIFLWEVGAEKGEIEVHALPCEPSPASR